MGWYIALGILVLIAVLPVGISLIYDEDGLLLSLLLGAVKIKLLPQKEKSNPEKKKERQSVKSPSSHAPKTPKKKKGGRISDFMPLVDVVIRFLGSFRRKLRIKRLELHWIMAAEDPCDLAISYGKAWAAVGNLVPLLERVFVIKNKDIQVSCDFLADSPRVIARLDATITIGRLTGLAVKYGILALKEFLKLRKGGAVS